MDNDRQRLEAAGNPPQGRENIVVTVNGERKTVQPGTTVSQLLNQLQLQGDRVAVELNRGIVRRGEWDSTPVGDGSSIEVVHFVGGG